MKKKEVSMPNPFYTARECYGLKTLVCAILRQNHNDTERVNSFKFFNHMRAMMIIWSKWNFCTLALDIYYKGTVLIF